MPAEGSTGFNWHVVVTSDSTTCSEEDIDLFVRLSMHGQPVHCVYLFA